MRIGIVAGESSGDILGAGLIRALRARLSDVHFEGVAGPEMLAAGCTALYPAETLSVMGFSEVLKHLPTLLRVRSHLRSHFLNNPPDIFIGIDSPGFNLGLERSLREAGIPTVHYVSPSVWAWKPKRIFKVGASADLVLAILPFEPALYAEHGFKAEFVGHPLADATVVQPDRAALRREFMLPEEARVVALLPGSRFSEVERLGRLFLDTAAWLLQRLPQTRFVIPAATPALRGFIEQMIQRHRPDLNVTLVEGRSRDVLSASDAVLLASGTAALEAMLLHCPMVVAYRLAPLSHAIVRSLRLLKVRYVSLPNVLAERELVPEFLQYRATPESMGEALFKLLREPGVRAAQLQGFRALEGVLRHGADERAAEAVLKLLATRNATRS